MSQSVGKEIKLLSRHSTVYGLTTALQRLASFILLPVYTRYLTPADYGTLDLLYLTNAYIGMLMEMGITAAMSRFYFDSDDQADRNVVVSSALVGFGFGSLVFTSIFIAGSGLLAQLVFGSAHYTEFVIMALVTLGLDMFNRVGYTYLRVRKRSFTLMMVSLAGLMLTIAFNVILLVAFHLGVRAMLWGTILAYLAQSLFFIPYIIRETGLRFSWTKLKEMIRYGLPLIPSEIMAYIVNTSDRYFLNAYHGLAATGLYSLAYRFGVLINRFVVNPFNQIWMPRRLETFQRGEAEQVYSRIFTYFSVMVCVGGLAIAVAAKEVILLITEQSYWSAYLVVPILILSYSIASFQTHFNIGILIKKKTTYMLYINAATAAVNLGLNFLLIGPYGIWGAAWATLFSFVVKVALIYILSNSLIRIVVEWTRLVWAFAAAIVLYWPISLIDTGSSLANLALKLTAVLVLPALLILTGFFSRDELTKGRQLAREALGKIFPRRRPKNQPVL